MSAGSLRERVARRLHTATCLLPHCSNMPDGDDYAGADAVLAVVREWLGEVVDSHKGTVAGRLSLADALAALIDRTKED